MLVRTFKELDSASEQSFLSDSIKPHLCLTKVDFVLVFERELDCWALHMN